MQIALLFLKFFHFVPLKFVVFMLCEFKVAVLYEPCLDLVSHAVEIDLYAFLAYKLYWCNKIRITSHKYNFVRCVFECH